MLDFPSYDKNELPFFQLTSALEEKCTHFVLNDVLYFKAWVVQTGMLKDGNAYLPHSQ